MVVKTLDLNQNPFADYGNIVSGERFVGRCKEINEIKSRVLGKNFGNLSIVGLPRIGKTSLVYNALIEQKEQLLNGQKIAVVFITMSVYNRAQELYTAIMEKTAKIIRDKDEKLFCSLSDATAAFTDCKKLEDFLFLSRHNGYRIIVILDEFDHCKNIFEINDFQFLRELSTMPETRLCLITTSRNTLQELEIRCGGISNFYGVFSDLRLELFHEERDLPLYWKWAEKNGIEVSQEYKQEILYYAGNHPFLIDLLNYHVFNKIVNENHDKKDLIENISSDIRNELWNQYQKILAVMEEEKLFKTLVQEIAGTVIEVKQEDIEKLMKYGLLRGSGQKGVYSTLSVHFLEYLRQKELEFDIWPLWNCAEQRLREVVRKFLLNKYGEDWIGPFIIDNPKQQAKIDEFQELMNGNKKRFGNLASDNLLRYTYPMDMWQIFIQSDWTHFQHIFNGNKAEWSERFSLLARIRNPIAHSNRDFINPDDVKRAKTICDLIIEKTNAVINAADAV